jgi:hypothetical protein
MSDENGRSQDQGRRHRRAGEPYTETTTLLAEYQASMRAELRGLLVDLRGKLPDRGLGLEPEPTEPVRPSLKERIPMWDLAMTLGRELGTEVDPARDAPGAVPATRARRRRVDFGGA